MSQVPCYEHLTNAARKTLERKMTRLIRYEFYKLFCKRSILVVLILFSVINLFKINNEFHSYSYLADRNDSRSWNSVYWQLYENIVER